MSIRFWLTVGALFPEFAQSFQLVYRPTRIAARNEGSLPLLWSSSQDDTDSEREADQSYLAEQLAPSRDRRKKKRSADYPSFSYCIDDSSSEITNVAMKYRGCGCEDVKFRRPPTVSIPEQSTDSMSALDRAVIDFYGGFESGLGGIGISALQTRLRKNRSYAKKESFAATNITVPPSLADLSYPPTEQSKGFWVTAPARALSVVVAYFLFPYLTRFLESFVTMSPESLDEITSKFGPGVSILYGTFISLTLSILYQRIKDIQDAAARESSMVTLCTRNLLSVFKNDRELAIEAAQCCADQVRTMVKSSRGSELMFVMYSDPYARILELIERHEEDLYEERGDFGPQGALIGSTRDIIKDLIRLRSERLSMEALSLPPTHFVVLNSLTLLILLSFTVSTLPAVDPVTGLPPNEGSIIFAILTNVYTLFYLFAKDLNNPFDGVYQIRRSCTACNLLEAKWLFANHPLLRGEVDFEEVEEGPDGSVIVCSPGLGEIIFEKDDLLVDGIVDTEEVES